MLGSMQRVWIHVTVSSRSQVSLTKAVVFGVMFVISFIGNTATLMQMYRLRRRKSTINTLIVNLALADLLVTFFCIAGEAIWAATVQWLAGTFTCKLVKYMQTRPNEYSEGPVGRGLTLQNGFPLTILHSSREREEKRGQGGLRSESLSK
ncbi:hypothetical protein C0Q70_19859 [Pomacea canaliculata]|uniref:G-protein coupled receptors family 1 profile domain-containing protein n=1 Tax=Pomacea canaliculata TaxID=400727 RepID=A0A2T7NDX7_POMCA|nr:hypothetical protein C0Q70_19859 [Pomacea canaliculata]